MAEHDWSEVREELLADPEVRREFERDAIAHGVAAWLLRCRTERGWSQRELARRVGMPQPVVARLEAGETEPRLSTLLRLVAALGTPLDLQLDPAEPAPPAVTVHARVAA